MNRDREAVRDIVYAVTLPAVAQHFTFAECENGAAPGLTVRRINEATDAILALPVGGGVEEALADCRDALLTLCSRHGYEDDHETPKDWSEWVAAREAVTSANALLAALAPRSADGLGSSASEVAG